MKLYQECCRGSISKHLRYMLFRDDNNEWNKRPLLLSVPTNDGIIFFFDYFSTSHHVKSDFDLCNALYKVNEIPHCECRAIDLCSELIRYQSTAK